MLQSRVLASKPGVVAAYPGKDFSFCSIATEANILGEVARDTLRAARETAAEATSEVV